MAFLEWVAAVGLWHFDCHVLLGSGSVQFTFGQDLFDQFQQALDVASHKSMAQKKFWALAPWTPCTRILGFEEALWCSLCIESLQQRNQLYQTDTSYICGKLVFPNQTRFFCGVVIESALQWCSFWCYDMAKAFRCAQVRQRWHFRCIEGINDPMQRARRGGLNRLSCIVHRFEMLGAELVTLLLWFLSSR